MARRQSYSPSKLFEFPLLKSSKMSLQMTDAPEIFKRRRFPSRTLRELQFLCESVELPGKSLATTEYRVAGDNRAKIPIARNFPEINLTFLHDEYRFPMYDFFNMWIELAAPREHTVEYYDDIVVKQGIELIQWKEDSNDAAIVVQLRNAFPVTVASMQGNCGDDNVQRVSVSLTFEDFKVVDGKNRLRLGTKRLSANMLEDPIRENLDSNLIDYLDEPGSLDIRDWIRNQPLSSPFA